MRRWLLFAIVVPVGAWALARLADRIADRRGESRGTAALRAPYQWRQRRA
jgi:hypothetical protein